MKHLIKEDIRISDINLITDRKTVYPIIQKMIQSGYIELKQQIKEKYKPKFVKFIRLKSKIKSKKTVKDILDDIKFAKAERNFNDNNKNR